MTEQEFLTLLGDRPNTMHLAGLLHEFLAAHGWHDMARKVSAELDTMSDREGEW